MRRKASIPTGSSLSAHQGGLIVQKRRVGIRLFTSPSRESRPTLKKKRTSELEKTLFLSYPLFLRAEVCLCYYSTRARHDTMSAFFYPKSTRRRVQNSKRTL